jgi:hypothetical protein
MIVSATADAIMPDPNRVVNCGSADKDQVPGKRGTFSVMETVKALPGKLCREREGPRCRPVSKRNRLDKSLTYPACVKSNPSPVAQSGTAARQATVRSCLAWPGMTAAYAICWSSGEQVCEGFVDSINAPAGKREADVFSRKVCCRAASGSRAALRRNSRVFDSFCQPASGKICECCMPARIHCRHPC